MEDKKDNRLKCSFCAKTQEQVKKLIAGPGVYICDECVDLCNEILDEGLFEGAPSAKTGATKVKSSSVQQMTSQLGPMDPYTLLHSLALAGMTCLITVEHDNSEFVMVLYQGKPVRARLGQLKGDEAVIEFIAKWTQGNIAIHEAVTEALDQECAVDKPLVRLCLDAAGKPQS